MKLGKQVRCLPPLYPRLSIRGDRVMAWPLMLLNGI
jgi:hypothetical protein